MRVQHSIESRGPDEWEDTVPAKPCGLGARARARTRAHTRAHAHAHTHTELVSNTLLGQGTLTAMNSGSRLDKNGNPYNCGGCSDAFECLSSVFSFGSPASLH